ncbi:MAG: glycosyltransferase [Spirochaetes bacterium]|nr:glycosyltransferase [Spirochaetota bacterium]
MPSFSVILPTFNRNVTVREAVDSVLGQTLADYELIVIDDGSTDDTAAIEQEYGSRLKYIRQENRGVSAARNTGVRVSSGDWIAFLDSDDLWLPEKLARQADYIASRPDVIIHQTDEQWIRKGRRVNPGRRHLKREGNIFIESLELCLISPSAVVMTRDCFDRYGPFDENLPACEDYDLWLKITKDEWIGLVPEQLVVRRGGHPDQLSSRYRGMDRFRVYSILRLLSEQGETLDPGYSAQAFSMLIKKSTVLLDGAKKRGRLDFADRLEEIMAVLSAGGHEFGDTGFLLTGPDWAD